MEPLEQRWQRHHPFLELDRAALEQRLRAVFPGVRVLAAAPLAGGLRNTNYRVRLAGQPAREVVVRLYTADPAACRREAALAARVRGAVPVPPVLHADPDADPPLAVTAWVEGTRLDEVLRAGDPAAVEGAACAAGAVLARIHAVTFAGPGFLGPDLEVREALDLGGAGWAGAMEHFLGPGRAGAALGADLVGRLRRLVAAQAPRLAPLRGARALVHADYKPWNLLVRPLGAPSALGAPASTPGGAAAAAGGWAVAAVLDWEFAFAGPPLVDVAIFLRHAAELPPEYARGFLAGYAAGGGRLPADWPAETKLLDLLNLCSMLAQPGGGAARARDIRSLILATVDAWAA